MDTLAPGKPFDLQSTTAIDPQNATAQLNLLHTLIDQRPQSIFSPTLILAAHDSSNAPRPSFPPTDQQSSDPSWPSVTDDYTGDGATRRAILPREFTAQSQIEKRHMIRRAMRTTWRETYHRLRCMEPGSRVLADWTMATTPVEPMPVLLFTTVPRYFSRTHRLTR